MACPPLLFPETQNCSGRGLLCLDGQCAACFPGWTGEGDFAFGSPSCNIFLPAARAVWGVLGVVHLAGLVPTLRLAWIKAKQLREAGAAWDALHTFATCACAYMGLMAATGIAKAVDPARVIGRDVLVTILFCTATSLFYGSALAFAYSFIGISLRQAALLGSDSLTSQFARYGRMRIVLSAYTLITTLYCMAPFGMLAAESQDDTTRFARLHYFGLATIIFLLGVVVLPLYIRPIVRSLEGSIATLGAPHTTSTTTTTTTTTNTNPLVQASFADMHMKLNRLLAQLRINVSFNLFVAILVGSWPYLIVCGSTYILPFAWLSACLLACLAALVSIPTATRSANSIVTMTESARSALTKRLSSKRQNVPPSSQQQVVVATNE